jgi:aminoglycoside phosphotransferase (APT) family kinase protein
MIRALGASPVPVPEVLWEDEGEPPGVPPLFVMSFVEGDTLEPLFDLAGSDVPPTVVAKRLGAAVRTMAALHRLDPANLYAGDEPVTGPADEVDRWCHLLETVDHALVPGWPDAEVALRSSAPAPLQPAVVHGDLRLGNMLAIGERITAIVDWEIWSVGDPRVDVGWLLLNADPETYRRRTPYAGSLPPPAELATTYAGETGRVLPDLPWFVALASFKSAATWSLIVKHNRRRPSPDPELEAMVPALPRLLARVEPLLRLPL